MTDIALRWVDGKGDVSVSAGDLLMEGGLQSAVMLSLFMDARAEDADVLPDGETDRRGWWGDQFAQEDNDRIGSKLWLLWREKRVPETLRRAQQYAEQALAWLKGDGVATAVTVTTAFATLAELTGSANDQDHALVIEVNIDKPDGTRESFRFAYQWQQQALVTY